MKQRRIHAMDGWKMTLALVCCAWLTAPLQAQTRQPSQAQAGQQAQSAAQARQAAAKEQGAATQQQTRKTDQANRAAAVADETSAAAAQAARTAQYEAAQYETAQARKDAGSGVATPPSYGPVLTPRAQQPSDPVRKDPAEVHDETDTRTRPAAPPVQPPQEPHASQQTRQPAQPRRPAAQAMTEPMAPRPLRSSVGTSAGASTGATAAVPVPPSAMPSRPVTPSSRVIGSCQGASCLDTNGNRYNGIGDGNAGVNSGGRLCTRTGVTVQCF